MANAEKQAASTSTRIDLEYPVEVDGQFVQHFDMRRPRVRDQLHADRQGGSRGDQEISMFASLTGVAPSVIESLDLKDYLALQTQYQNFLS